MAAVMNFTCLFLIMFFCFTSVWLSSALPLRQDDNATSELTTISKTNDQKGSSAWAASTYSGKVGGRKGSLHNVVGLAKVKPQGGKKKMANGVQKLNSKQATSSAAARISAKIDEAAGFVAFNADYRTPRHHPPKNNR